MSLKVVLKRWLTGNCKFKNNQIVNEYEACLFIQFELERWTVENIYQLFFYTRELIKVLPENNSPIEISDILKGSFFETLWGDIKQLLLTGRLLDLEK